ncbi:MAG: cheW 1 [Firmicutes bacterium]|nr:cheW 1 [Bacillota bacterium]
MSENYVSNGDNQLVVFKLGREDYGVSILQVQEIKRMLEIARVPHSPNYVKGVVNLRGNVLPVIDLKKRLGLAPGECTDDTRVIIVKVADIVVGIIVDAVSEVTSIDAGSIEPPQTIVNGVNAQYLSGVGKHDDRLLILLNLEAIVGIDLESGKIAN